MYPDSRNLRTGNILLCHTKKGLEARIIRAVLNSFWNHAAVVLQLQGQTFIVEAAGGKLLGVTPYATWLQQRERIIEVIPATCPEVDLLSYCGTTYDLTSCFNLLLKKLFGTWYGRKTGKGKQKIYCFEFVALVHGIERWYEATPASIIKHFSGQPA